MNNSRDTRNILICIAEAVIISLCVIAAGIYIKYLDYSNPTFYFCDAQAFFDHSIMDTSGKEYPEETEFRVNFIDSYGRLSLRVERDDTDIGEIDENLRQIDGLFFDDNWHLVETTESLFIDDAVNSQELSEVFEALKQKERNNFLIDCIKICGLGLLICIISFAVFFAVNRLIKNKNSRIALLIITCVLSVSLSILYVWYLSRAI